MTTTRKRETKTVTIKIELTTETLTSGEAGALAAFLLTLHPDAVAAALGSLGEVTETQTVGEISISRTAPDVETLRAMAERDDVMPAEAGAPLTDAPTPFVPATNSERGAPGALPIDPGTPTLTPEQAFGAAQVTHSEAPDGDAAPGHVASPVSPPAAPALDAEGLPWDERIHSSNHKQSANGVWMKRRGVLPDVDAQVRSELRQTYPASAPTLTAAQRTMQAAVSEGLIPSPPVSTAVPVPPAPTSVAVPAPPVAAPTTDASLDTPQPTASANTPDNGANTGNTESATSAASPSNGPAEFQRIMQKLAGPGGYQPSGRVTLEQTNAIVASMGLTGLADLLKNPDRIPEFEAQIDAAAGAA
jgi:hypothetical protein